MVEPTKRISMAMRWLEDTVKKHPSGVIRGRMEYILMKKWLVTPGSVINLCIKSGLMEEEIREDGVKWLVWQTSIDKEESKEESE